MGKMIYWLWPLLAILAVIFIESGLWTAVAIILISCVASIAGHADKNMLMAYISNFMQKR